MENKITVDEAFDMWWLILRTRRAMHKARSSELNEYKITAKEAAALFAINTSGNGATPTQISRFLLREPHTIVMLLQRMQKNGLVTLTKDTKRKNLTRITITEKGREAYVKSMVRKSIHNIMSIISEEEQQQLRAIMMKLLTKALEELEEYRKPRFAYDRISGGLANE